MLSAPHLRVEVDVPEAFDTSYDVMSSLDSSFSSQPSLTMSSASSRRHSTTSFPSSARSSYSSEEPVTPFRDHSFSFPTKYGSRLSPHSGLHINVDYSSSPEIFMNHEDMMSHSHAEDYMTSKGPLALKSSYAMNNMIPQNYGFQFYSPTNYSRQQQEAQNQRRYEPVINSSNQMSPVLPVQSIESLGHYNDGVCPKSQTMPASEMFLYSNGPLPCTPTRPQHYPYQPPSVFTNSSMSDDGLEIWSSESFGISDSFDMLPSNGPKEQRSKRVSRSKPLSSRKSSDKSRYVDVEYEGTYRASIKIEPESELKCQLPSIERPGEVCGHPFQRKEHQTRHETSVHGLNNPESFECRVPGCQTKRTFQGRRDNFKQHIKTHLKPSNHPRNHRFKVEEVRQLGEIYSQACDDFEAAELTAAVKIAIGNSASRRSSGESFSSSRVNRRTPPNKRGSTKRSSAALSKL
jgi:hypothetical protein